jgi:hypothetical protein
VVAWLPKKVAYSYMFFPFLRFLVCGTRTLPRRAKRRHPVYMKLLPGSFNKVLLLQLYRVNSGLYYRVNSGLYIG